MKIAHVYSSAVAVGIALLTGLWNEVVSWVRDAFVSNTTLPI